MPAVQLVERPLSDLSPEAVALLDAREGRVGVAVLIPGQQMYTYRGDELFPLASVTKVMIMVELMDRAVNEGRPLTDAEVEALWPMITWSDNFTAQQLWDELGGGDALSDMLHKMSLTQTQPAPSAAWGDTLSSPREVALLLGKLVTGDILDQHNRELALALMSGVAPVQAWGATAGVVTDEAVSATVAVKNGWYPADDGWWVNSAAMILLADERPAYTLVIFTDQQPSDEYGIATIEAIAREVHAALGLHVLPLLVPRTS
jgi:hypothetical protein